MLQSKRKYLPTSVTVIAYVSVLRIWLVVKFRTVFRIPELLYLDLRYYSKVRVEVCVLLSNLTMEEPFSTTPTKKWLKPLNMEHIYHVFEEFGFTTVGSLKEMKEEDIDTIFCTPNKLKLGERRVLVSRLRSLQRKVNLQQTFNFSGRSIWRLNWVSVKNGNRNDRIRNGSDWNRKWMPNFPHEFQFLPILCGKLDGNFRFRSFPFQIRSFRFQIRSFRFPFFTETQLNWNNIKVLLECMLMWAYFNWYRNNNILRTVQLYVLQLKYEFSFREKFENMFDLQRTIRLFCCGHAKELPCLAGRYHQANLLCTIPLFCYWIVVVLYLLQKFWKLFWIWQPIKCVILNYVRNSSNGSVQVFPFWL